MPTIALSAWLCWTHAATPLIGGCFPKPPSRGVTEGAPRVPRRPRRRVRSGYVLTRLRAVRRRVDRLRVRCPVQTLVCLIRERRRRDGGCPPERRPVRGGGGRGRPRRGVGGGIRNPRHFREAGHPCGCDASHFARTAF